MDETYSLQEVADILADAIREECACNINGNDEWLSYCCDYRETDCPHPGNNGCWEQWLKWRHKREDQYE